MNAIRLCVAAYGLVLISGLVIWRAGVVEPPPVRPRSVGEVRARALTDRVVQLHERLSRIEQRPFVADVQVRTEVTNPDSPLFEVLNARMTQLEARWVDTEAVPTSYSRMYERLVHIAKLRAQILDPRSSALERAAGYWDLSRLEFSSLNIDRRIAERWLNDVFVESGDPTVARYLAMSVGRFSLDEDVALGSFHLARHPDVMVRTGAVVCLGWVGGSDMRLAETARRELKAIAVTDPSEKVREKAWEELSAWNPR